MVRARVARTQRLLSAPAGPGPRAVRRNARSWKRPFCTFGRLCEHGRRRNRHETVLVRARMECYSGELACFGAMGLTWAVRDLAVSIAVCVCVCYGPTGRGTRTGH
eukprot:4002527-Prymnesium_polylepis.1